MLFLLLGPAAETGEAGLEIPERRLIYTTDSLLIRGQATVDYEYGVLDRMARELPYDNSHAAGRRQFRDNTKQQVLRIGGEIDVSFMPHYFMEAYIDSENGRTLRAVRWKKGFPDVLLDFLSGGEVLITRAKPLSQGLLRRVGEWFQPPPAENMPEFVMRGPYDQVRTGGNLSDLMSVLFTLEKKFTVDDGPPGEPFYISAMRKDTSNIYVGRFVPRKQESIIVEVNGEALQRSAVRCEVTLSYGYPVDLQEGQTITSLAGRYMPDKPLGEAAAIIRGIIGAESLADYDKKSLVVPISMPLYNDIHDSDEDFEGPFGLSESVTLWVDEELGIPLRAECRLYSLSVAVVLSQSDDDYLHLLQGGG